MSGDTVLYTFQWDTDATSVVVTGTFDNWSGSKQLTRNKENNKFEITVPLLKYEKALFKFIVDGQWLTASNYNTENDSAGIENNVILPQELIEYESVIPEALLNNDQDKITNNVDKGTSETENSSDSAADAKPADGSDAVYAQKSAVSETTLNSSSSSTATLDAKNVAAFEEIQEDEKELENNSKEKVGSESRASQSEIKPTPGKADAAEEQKNKDQNVSASADQIASTPIDRQSSTPSVKEKEHESDWEYRKAKVSRSIDLNEEKENEKQQLTASNTESSVVVSIPSPKKKDFQTNLAAQQSNTESSAFTNIDTPSQPDTKEAENGLNQIVGDQNSPENNAILLNSLHLDDLESSASFKSISSNEIFSSTHGTLSNFNMQDSDDKNTSDKTNIAAAVPAAVTTGQSSKGNENAKFDRPSSSFSLVSKFKRIFK